MRALVQLDAPPELALFEWGRAPRVMHEPALGVLGARPAVQRRVSHLPRRWLPVAARCGFRADRWLGGVDIFHHIRPEFLPIASARQTMAISEFPPPGSRAESELRRKVSALDAVLVFSSAYRDRVCATFGVASARVHRVPVGCDHWRRDLAALPPPAEPARVLVLGALRNQRSPVAVLRGFEALARAGSGAELVWIGRSGDAAESFERARAASPVRERVRWVPELSERELAVEVASATVLLHLSSDEGTAVTPLEALSLGPAVVVSRLSAFEEVLAHHAIWVDTAQMIREPARLAEALALGLTHGADPRLRDERGHFAARFRWLGAAQATVDVWRTLLEAPRGA